MNDMAEITRTELPSFRSHSQVSAYLQCPRSYELARVRRLKRRPGAWFPGGTAVHATIERYLRQQVAEEREGQ
jgi:hypothetical protein